MPQGGCRPNGILPCVFFYLKEFRQEPIPMNDTIQLTHLKLQIDKEKVFTQLHCYPDSPVYEEMEETFEELLPQIHVLCKPEGLMGRGTIPADCRLDGFAFDADAVFLLLTVGQEVSTFSTRCFEEGDYVRGMLVDAMADAALFSLEADALKALRDFCREQNFGIRRRLEAPHDLTMKIQAEVLHQLKADQILGLRITEGFMYSPLKTSCNVYMTSEDPNLFKAQHNCRKCPNVTCSLRHIEPVTVTVQKARNSLHPSLISTDHRDSSDCITFALTGTLLEGLRQSRLPLTSPCGGSGICGKCRIRLLKGHLDITAEDRTFFTEQELDAGWRLACRALPDEDITIELPAYGEKNFSAVSGFSPDASVPSAAASSDISPEGSASDYRLAIDIGTTTLAFQLIRGNFRDTDTMLNPQRPYGADVISRIQASCQGKKELLRSELLHAIHEGISSLLRKNRIGWNNLTHVALAGNTTMIHLLMGYPCDGLGCVPFRPYHIGKLEVPLKEWYPEAAEHTSATIYPGISAFVGADIVSGICALGMMTSDRLSLLVDLGTNGEMALGTKGRLLVTSTAAGPAFEGGNIICGTGSIPGAVCSAVWEKDHLHIDTIGHRPPCGICGTGIIELISELLRAEIMDETGRMEDPWREQGYEIAIGNDGSSIRLYQKDVRELQLAKAAVRAGLETLLHRYGITASDVDQIYIAGGFGCQLDYEKAIHIGLFPETFAGKIHAVGNSSLGGAALLAEHPELMETAETAASLAEEVSLADDPFFQAAYMEHMTFDTE